MTQKYAITPASQTLAQNARVWLNLHDDELKRRAVRAAHTKDSTELISLVNAYLTQHGQSGTLTSPHTLSSYATGIRQYLTYAEAHAVNILRPGRHDPQAYVTHLLAAGRSPAGTRLKVAAARALHRALIWAAATDTDPFTQVHVPKDTTSPHTRRPAYTETEITAVLQVADPHEQFLLFLTAHAGLRIGEALSLTWDDLDEGGRRIHVRHGKGRKERTVTMSARLAAAAQHYRLLYSPGGPHHAARRRATASDHVFRYAETSTARYHLQKAFSEAGIPFKGFHAGRKYAGTRLLRQLQDFGRVANHLGHASIDTTRKHYATVAEDDLDDALNDW